MDDASQKKMSHDANEEMQEIGARWHRENSSDQAESLMEHAVKS